jgi:hypothetical protein
LNPVTLKLQKGNLTRIRKFEKFSFLMGGIILLISIYDRYTSGGLIPGTFGATYQAAYIIGGLANIFAGVFYSKIPVDKIESIGKWLQIIIAALLLFDAIDKLMKGKIAMPIALILASILYFLVAIFTGRLKGRRFLTIEDDQILFRKSLLKIRRVRIEDLKAISYSPQRIVLTMMDNKAINLFPAQNDDETIRIFTDRLNDLKTKLTTGIN